LNSCSQLDEEKLKRMGLGESNFVKDILKLYEQRNNRIKLADIDKDITMINDKIKKYGKIYHKLKKINDKTLEQQAEQVLYKEEIKDLKKKKEILKELKQEFKKEETMFGGGDAVSLKPSEQYMLYNNPMQYNNQGQYNPMQYNNQGQYNPMQYNNQGQYNPMQYNNQGQYNSLQPFNPNNMIYIPKQGLYYFNSTQNKEKDQKSKLSFYINVELELFPGTSANMLEKSMVKCQTTFERIREAWANIFGYEYRPSPMYYNLPNDNLQNEDKKNKTEKKNTINNNNKTQKNRI
jgi:hypothetical protein